MTAGEDATGVAIAGLKDRMDRHEETSVREHGDIWRAIGLLRKSVHDVTRRPPAWCTGVISVLTFLLGIAVTLIGVLSRL